MTELEPVPSWLTEALVNCGLALSHDSSSILGAPLTGGVSSDIWVAFLSSGPVCVKRALARLRVAAVWEAPTERSASEAAWLARARCVDATAVPRLLGYDPATRALALGWLDPGDHPQWKDQLLSGHIDGGVAVALGDRLGRFHAAMTSAADPDAPLQFANQALFESLRLEPYFGTTAVTHPELRVPLARLRADFVTNASTVVHGDVSPKNVLVGPTGPVLLDAECATWGDPAFDPAFLLSHLLLKARHRPSDRLALRRCADDFWTAYVSRVAWDDAAALESRTTAYWAALVLARIDGSSPLEFLSTVQRDRARDAVMEFVAHPPDRLADLDPLWSDS